ncbi:hypothetical protein JOY44_25225 (plasmid) [Phormidium sp. CLA17]|nr:hypothetical protein [Leptolyngbya sp. Cla-17]
MSPSAYPLAFPEALASETILPPHPMRLTTCSDIDHSESGRGGYFVPIFRFALTVGSHSPPGFLLSACRSALQLPASYPFPFGQAHKPA